MTRQGGHFEQNHQQADGVASSTPDKEGEDGERDKDDDQDECSKEDDARRGKSGKGKARKPASHVTVTRTRKLHAHK